MPWYNPFTWFRRPPPPVAREPAPIRFSRAARDSTNIPMDTVFTMRIPDELRERGARRARELGLSFGEYMRALLAEDLNEGREQERAKVIQMDGPDSR